MSEGAERGCRVEQTDAGGESPSDPPEASEAYCNTPPSRIRMTFLFGMSRMSTV